MQCWSEACRAEKKQFEAISTIVSLNPHLLGFLFDSARPQLKCAPQDLLCQAKGFSSSEYLLVRICLNLWCEQGQLEVHELFNLDPDLFKLTMTALAQLGS